MLNTIDLVLDIKIWAVVEDNNIKVASVVVLKVLIFQVFKAEAE